MRNRIKEELKNLGVFSDARAAAASTAGGTVIYGVTMEHVVAWATAVYFIVYTGYILIKCWYAIRDGRESKKGKP